MTELIEPSPEHRFDEVRRSNCVHGAVSTDFRPGRPTCGSSRGQSKPTFLPLRWAVTCCASRPENCCPRRSRRREYRVHSALRATPPRPDDAAALRRRTVIGTPFYVMDSTRPHLRWPGDAAAPNVLDRRAAYLEIAEALGRLHRGRPRYRLRDYGSAEGYAARQIERWTRRAAAKTRHIRRWMADRLAASARAGPRRGGIAHGDFRSATSSWTPAGRCRRRVDWESRRSAVRSPSRLVCMSYRIPASMTLLNGLRGLICPRTASLRGGACRRLLPKGRPRRAARSDVLRRAVVLPLSVRRARRLCARAAGNAADRRASLAGQAAIALAEEGGKSRKRRAERMRPVI